MEYSAGRWSSKHRACAEDVWHPRSPSAHDRASEADVADEDSDGELVGFEQPGQEYPQEQGPVSPEWLSMYLKLQQYKEQYGDCNVPR